MSNAFLSWASLFSDQDPLGSTGKLIALWFDTLIIETPKDNVISNTIEYSIEKEEISREIGDQLLDHWKPIQQYLPDYEYALLPDRFDNTTKQLREITVESVMAALDSEYPELKNQYALIREAMMTSWGVLRAYNSWYPLNALHSVSFLTNQFESTVAKEYFIRSGDRDFNTFHNFANYLIPDLSVLSWEKVLELRHHSKLEEFRNKISMISGENTEITSIEAAKEVEREFVSDLAEFAKLCRPSPVNTLAKTVISNIPLPIPVNPASIAFGNREFWESLNLDKRYGWMFFGIDFKN